MHTNGDDSTSTISCSPHEHLPQPKLPDHGEIKYTWQHTHTDGCNLSYVRTDTNAQDIPYLNVKGCFVISPLPMVCVCILCYPGQGPSLSSCCLGLHHRLEPSALMVIVTKGYFNMPFIHINSLPPMNWTNKAVPLPSREAHNIHCRYEKKKERERGRLWCFTFDFPFRLIGAPQLVRPVTCRSFTDKQGRHGSITHSYNVPFSPPSLRPMMKR